jgi:abortive infection bacteriophage resistance protein
MAEMNFGLFLQGFTFNDIIQKSVFVSDQREVVVSVIRRIEPNFEPYNISPDMCYSCNLLRELNSQNQNGMVSRGTE